MRSETCFSFFLTAVWRETLVADFAEALEAVVEVSHFLLQLSVLVLQQVLFGVALHGGDHVFVDF